MRIHDLIILIILIDSRVDSWSNHTNNIDSFNSADSWSDDINNDWLRVQIPNLIILIILIDLRVQIHDYIIGWFRRASSWSNHINNIDWLRVQIHVIILIILINLMDNGNKTEKLLFRLKERLSNLTERVDLLHAGQLINPIPKDLPLGEK